MIRTATLYTCNIPLLTAKALQRAKMTGMFPRNVLTKNTHWVYEDEFEYEEPPEIQVDFDNDSDYMSTTDGEWELLSESDISD